MQFIALIDNSSSSVGTNDLIVALVKGSYSPS